MSLCIKKILFKLSLLPLSDTQFQCSLDAQGIFMGFKQTLLHCKLQACRPCLRYGNLDIWLNMPTAIGASLLIPTSQPGIRVQAPPPLDPLHMPLSYPCLLCNYRLHHRYSTRGRQQIHCGVSLLLPIMKFPTLPPVGLASSNYMVWGMLTMCALIASTH